MLRATKKLDCKDVVVVATKEKRQGDLVRFLRKPPLSTLDLKSLERSRDVARPVDL